MKPNIKRKNILYLYDELLYKTHCIHTMNTIASNLEDRLLYGKPIITNTEYNQIKSVLTTMCIGG